ncbi:MAG TPA: hypothetical protein DEB39_15935 [Planctomycetaceae bacterium]|nr:hypothetical protein [Planctomycetaceae bacterium]
MADNYVSAILPMPDAMPLIGLYIGGVIKPQMELSLKTKNKPLEGRPVYSVAQSDFAALPSPIKPPNVAEIKAMQAKLEKLNKPLPKIYAAYYGEDWKTQGDWVGRYGRQYAVMCGASSPFDQVYFIDESCFKVRGFIGPNRPDGDTIRRWVHWVKTDNPRSMYSPLNGFRRQAEWDDHGEVYPLSKDGPDLWYQIEIANEGLYRVGTYFMNKDGHAGHNRHRDYMIEVYPSSLSWKKQKEWEKFSQFAESQSRRMVPLAKSRMRDFWGGVHKNFYFAGPGNYLVKIKRNYSFNTILSSVTVDRLSGAATYHDKMGLSRMQSVPYPIPELPTVIPNEVGRAAARLQRTLDARMDKQGAAETRQETLLSALVAVTKHPASNEAHNRSVAQSLRWRLNQWDVHEQERWNAFVQEAWKRTRTNDPEHISKQDAYMSGKKNPWKGWPR